MYIYIYIHTQSHTHVNPCSTIGVVSAPFWANPANRKWLVIRVKSQLQSGMVFVVERMEVDEFPRFTPCDNYKEYMFVKAVQPRSDIFGLR